MVRNFQTVMFCIGIVIHIRGHYLLFLENLNNFIFFIIKYWFVNPQCTDKKDSPNATTTDYEGGSPQGPALIMKEEVPKTDCLQYKRTVIRKRGILWTLSVAFFLNRKLIFVQTPRDVSEISFFVHALACTSRLVP